MDSLLKFPHLYACFRKTAEVFTNQKAALKLRFGEAYFKTIYIYIYHQSRSVNRAPVPVAETEVIHFYE
jgi:hypothetical protein